MAWIIATASNYKDCLERVKDFCIKETAAGAITPGGGNTGNGTVYGASATADSVAETWTLTCTTGGGNEVAVFSVSGSVSGAQADATAGVPYSIDEVSFIITAGSVDFVSSDSFTFTVASSTAEWVVDRWDTDYDGSGGYELIMHGIGSGSDEIYIGYNTKTNSSTYWNWLVTGLTGYIGANTMANQPGYFPYYDCMNNVSFTFVCIMTSRHVKVIPYAASVQGGSYIGWMLPHATPSQWSYPMYCGGSTDDVSQLIGTYEDDHTCYWAAYSNEFSGAVLDISLWREINKFSPRHYGSFTTWRPDLITDEMYLYPAVPIHEDSDNVYGTLEGVYWPTQYATGTGLLTAGDVIITDDVTALCFQDVNRSAAGDLIAMDLMGDTI